MSFRIKKGDNVVLLTGKDKGNSGKVIFVNPDASRVKVENINMVSKAKKAKNAQDSGGITKMEGNIHISNVMILCPACNAATRIAVKIENGKRVRACKKCGAALEIKAEKAKRTKKDKEKDQEAKKTDGRVKRTRKPKQEEAAPVEKPAEAKPAEAKPAEAIEE